MPSVLSLLKDIRTRIIKMDMMEWGMRIFQIPGKYFINRCTFQSVRLESLLVSKRKPVKRLNAASLAHRNSLAAVIPFLFPGVPSDPSRSLLPPSVLPDRVPFQVYYTVMSGKVLCLRSLLEYSVLSRFGIIQGQNHWNFLLHVCPSVHLCIYSEEVY